MSAIYNHSDIQIAQYENTDALNQSGIKAIIDGGMMKYLSEKEDILKNDELYFEEVKHFKIGKAVDYRVTSGEDVFYEKYHISKMIKQPGDKAKSIVKSVYDKLVESGTDLDSTSMLSEFSTLVLEVCEEHEFQPKWGAEAKINKGVNKDGLGQIMFSDLIESKGKILLSEEEQSIIRGINNSLLNHPFTAHLFESHPDKIIIYQLPIYFTLPNGIKGKALIDMLIIDLKNKRILIIDIKTIGDYVNNFNAAIKKRRYDIQGSYYSYGLHQSNVKESISELIGIDIRQFTIAPFAFIVESTIKSGLPLVFVMNEKLIRQAEQGGNFLLGWRTVSDVYKAWQEEDFNAERIYSPKKGVQFVDEYFNIVN